jgi:hypothetical protein
MNCNYLAIWGSPFEQLGEFVQLGISKKILMRILFWGLKKVHMMDKFLQVVE